MRKAIYLIIALLLFSLAPASAYYSTYDPFYENSARFALDTKYSYHINPPNFYSYYRDCTYCKPWNDGWDEEIAESYALGWAINNYNKRYRAAAGKPSGDTFYQTVSDQKPTPQTNWRNKPAYDARKYTYKPYKDYYYEPTYDHNLGYYNWRY